MDSRTFWSFHQCLPGKLHFGEWLFADKSLKRLMRKIRFGKVIQGGGDFIYIQWSYSGGREFPEIRPYNLRTYGLIPCSLLNESRRMPNLTEKRFRSVTKPINISILIQHFEKNMAKKIYHIRSNTKKERKDLIHKIQFMGKYGYTAMAAFANDVNTSYSLYQLFDYVHGLQEKDPFRFMVLIHNAVFETVEITDKEIVKSVATYSYDDLVKRYESILKGV